MKTQQTDMHQAIDTPVKSGTRSPNATEFKAKILNYRQLDKAFTQVSIENDERLATASLRLAEALKFAKAALSQPVMQQRTRTVAEKATAFLILREDCETARQAIDEALAQWEQQ
jgi:hypothetical protein